MINVQLKADGPITQMDESLLEKREGVVDNDNEHTTWVEFWVPGSSDRAIHRSVHVTLKQGLGIEAAMGSFS